MADRIRGPRGLRVLIWFGAATVLLTGCVAGGDAQQGEDVEGSSTATAEPDCLASDSLDYVCGLHNAEDIVQVGTTKWLLASNLAAPDEPGAGMIYLIDSEERIAEESFPGESPVLRNDAATYPDCPSIDLDQFEVQGLALRETEAGMFLLYATTHGAVEAIQAWELDATADQPQLTWIGCVPLPDGMYANSVSILSDGGFVSTKFYDTAGPTPNVAIGRGDVTGELYEWHPGGPVTAIPNTQLSGANGIELSADERYMYVAAYGSHEIVRFDRGSEPGPNVSIAVDIAPDNLRWTQDGTLLTAGVNVTAGTGWSVLEIDPSTLTATNVAAYARDVTLQNASTALAVGDEVWIGTWRGDRVGYYSAR